MNSAKKGIIFTDRDGTFVFHRDTHNIEELCRYNDKKVYVRDLKENTAHWVYDVSSILYISYFDYVTRDLFLELKKDFELVMVSGARYQSVFSSKSTPIDFFDTIILENGGIIFYSESGIDKEWEYKLESQIKSLSDVNNYLSSQGWVMDNYDRHASIRVRLKDNPRKDKEEFEYLKNKFVLPPELKKTLNFENLEIIPSNGGKENAVRYLTEKMDYKIQQVHGIGDDTNDIEFLKLVGFSYVLKNGFPDVILEARKNKWYISERHHFEGINEILEKILGRNL